MQFLIMNIFSQNIVKIEEKEVKIQKFDKHIFIIRVK